MKAKTISVYHSLLKKHSYQGWWPINGKYNPRDYNYPHNEKEIFEVCTGAILTQNTSWKNVERALSELKRHDLLFPNKIISCEQEKLAEVIKSSGWYNQKARKLKEFAEFFISLDGKVPTREELLSVWGIGKETADSILLYAYKKPYFVVDEYTKRFFSHLKLGSYEEWQDFFHKNLPEDYKIFNEFHALIVAEAKTRKATIKHPSKVAIKPLKNSCN